ncbi:hypothetical protein C100_10925 [Sphingobium sp. C100]|jgi:hypothetical protein|uniref:hypothetical protein n=1 Tax=Sphingobium sp. C100 TaxID=1207055 RepID=UPI0003D5EDE2|nr:hypothetical protein [Sphingobium sp. C100]ETI63805.1 hypothetical protein C100_10925 [Sphingobium sp. C100]
MQNMGEGSCPFTFNTDPATFKVGDSVSYRVTGGLEGIAFAGVLMEVHDDHVVLTSNPEDEASRMRATRESRPLVREEDVC